MNHFLTRVLLPAGITLSGIACTGLLIALGPSTAPASGDRSALSVEVSDVELQTVPATVTGTGVVAPDIQVAVMPEVAGRITWVADPLRPGVRLAKGDVIARVDSRDYKTALLAEEARLTQAEVSLLEEKERQSHARRQWELLGDGRESEQARLALRKPQLKLAEANLDSAEASVARARRNLGRTGLRTPFNAIVLTENVDVGQIVGASSQIATLAGTDQFRVPVSVPVEQLALIEVPGLGTDSQRGSPAVVVQKLPQGEVVRTGAVLGIDGQLDPQTRTANVLVAIDAPLDVDAGELPLLPGAFVDVSITGRAQPSIATIPRHALHDGTHVWVVQDGTLAKRDVKIAFEDTRNVYIGHGLQDGDQVITSRISTPIAGQPVVITQRPSEVGSLE